MTNSTVSRKTPAKVGILIAVVLVILGASYVFVGNQADDATEASLGEAQTAEIEKAIENTDTTASVVMSSTIDLESAMTERVLGDATAPIKITEHASLTCNHCADFHKNTLPEIIKNYIDTGKAYLVFSDFPLNAPALHASMAARCLPESQYFDFIKALFDDQDNWAFGSAYLTILKQKAAGFGMSEATFEACLGSEELQKNLLERMKAVQERWSISSTPSFVINNQVVISGALGYEDFDKRLQDAVKEIENKNSDAETEAPPSDPVEGQ